MSEPAEKRSPSIDMPSMNETGPRMRVRYSYLSEQFADFVHVARFSVTNFARLATEKKIFWFASGSSSRVTP